MPTTRTAAPIFAALLLLLAIYVGSYYVMVLPVGFVQVSGVYGYIRWAFWPVEQVDRRLRPECWYLIEEEPRDQNSHSKPETPETDWFDFEPINNVKP
ncbi:hypothetical protein ETAA8_33340 [Anatilimnocola aggregata]|uniref:Uncharacterized protein n=1 Tax=Anatilimnocola aggregata TaxID=2528021 RepID=A0A517YDC6_9BACT|nr:hypothetical protein [Anatilimnocola aggregata]QDU28234.1 hypothetical protein ETAA8_33340 [Anatilimnocola aggregata]